jgi:hypothetical protein
MSPHRRRAIQRALLEIKGALMGITGEQIATMSNAELLALYVEVEKSFEGANITEPTMGTPIGAVVEKKIK